MNKPTVLAILNAVEKIYLPILQNKFGTEEGKALNSHSLCRLLCEMEPQMNAHRAEVMSRKVAIAELRKAITDGIEMHFHNCGICQEMIDGHSDFLAEVTPWLNRLES